MELMLKREYRQKEKEKKELESIIEKVPYSLPVALIKICLLKNYFPLGIEKYYELISPTFHLLRRTDGSRYHSNSIKTVRAAMLSEELFYKNDEGLYELNLQNALKHIRAMKKKKENDDNILIAKLNQKRLKKELRNKARLQKMLGKRKKINRDELNLKEKKAKRLPPYGKYGNAYKLFANLLKLTKDNLNIYPKLNLDLDNFNSLGLEEENQNSYKIIGMLIFFNFFRPFLEKSFNRIYDNIN